MAQAKTAVGKLLALTYKSAWGGGTARRITGVRRGSELRCTARWRYERRRLTEKARVLRLGGAVRAVVL